MKPYGIPRHIGTECPDKGDITNYGLSSKHGKSRSKKKRMTRRIWKKRYRTALKHLNTGDDL